MSDQEPKRSRGNPAWRRGGPSPNPAGRPRTGLAFAERVRERVAPDQIIDEALRIMTTAEKESDRLAAMVFLHGSGYIKPPAQLEIDASIAPAPPRTIDVTALPLPEQRQLLELLQRARAALPAGEGGES